MWAVYGSGTCFLSELIMGDSDREQHRWKQESDSQLDSNRFRKTCKTYNNLYLKDKKVSLNERKILILILLTTLIYCFL